MKIILKTVKAILPEGERVCDVRIADGRITEIKEGLEPVMGETVRQCDGLILMPGFIDTHTHGGMQTAFFHTDSDLNQIVAQYAKRGTTAIAPTFSCMPFEQFEQGVKRVAAFAKTNKSGAKIPGIHSEGPFLNPERSGGMIPEYMVSPTVEYYKKIYNACEGLLKIITLAPEIPGAHDVIKEAVADRVFVSAGHTNATYSEMKSAVDMGVSRITHTFNAMRPIGHREPGVIGAAFEDSRVNCEAICDFGHLHPTTVAMIIKQKGTSGVTVVSDYSDRYGKAAKGEGEHEVDGERYYIRNGVAWTPSGSVISNSNDMLVSVKNLYHIGISLQEIAVMASLNPAKALGIDHLTGSIETGKAADLVLLDSQLSVVDTYVDGQGLEYEKGTR